MTKGDHITTTYVIGHKNPDTDSICSAIAYAQLATLCGERGVVAAAQGETRPETRYILERWGVPPPVIVRDVRPRVRDVMTTSPISVMPQTTLLDVSRKIERHNVRAIPIVDDQNRLVGLFSVEDFAGLFLTGLAPEGLDTVHLDARNMAATIDGEILAAAEGRALNNKFMVGAMDSPSMREWMIKEGCDSCVMVIGDREDAQHIAVDAGIGVLIVTGNTPVSEKVLQLAYEKNTWVILSPHDTYTTIRYLIMSIPVDAVMQRDPVTVAPEDLAEDALQLVIRRRRLPVVSAGGTLVGMISRSDLLKRVYQRVILVDHNERSQSVAGLDQAELVGIIDHHRIADVQTARPIFIRMEPVGATCTIIAEMYEDYAIPVPKHIAGVMLGAILVDTVILRSPTCTQRDRDVAEKLAAIAGVDPVAYGTEIFMNAQDVEGKTARELILGDFKEFTFGQYHYGVGVLETMHTRVVEPLKPELIEELTKLRLERGYKAMLLAVVDIIHDKSEILVSGGEKNIAEAFGQPIENHTILVNSLVVRKRDIVPALARAAEQG